MSKYAFLFIDDGVDYQGHPPRNSRRYTRTSSSGLRRMARRSPTAARSCSRRGPRRRSARAPERRAIALWHVHGAEQAYIELFSLADELDRYHLFHATRAELLRALGRSDEARAADRRALELTENPAERALLAARLA